MVPRKTLESIPYYPSSQELYDELMQSAGWPYRTNREGYIKRDRALVALLYLAELRISEALRIKKNQFKPEHGHLLIHSILLSKRKPGKVQYRDARLPLKGERAPFTQLIQNHLETLESEDRLFPWSLRVYEAPAGFYINKKGEKIMRKQVHMVGCSWAWKIVNALLPNYTQHWLRAFGEDYLYDAWDHDLLAVSDQVKVDPRTLALYLRKRHEKYQVV